MALTKTFLADKRMRLTATRRSSATNCGRAYRPPGGIVEIRHVIWRLDALSGCCRARNVRATGRSAAW